jgi:radical SAM superfamily enzyme
MEIKEYIKIIERILMLNEKDTECRYSINFSAFANGYGLDATVEDRKSDSRIVCLKSLTTPDALYDEVVKTREYLVNERQRLQLLRKEELKRELAKLEGGIYE